MIRNIQKWLLLPCALGIASAASGQAPGSESTYGGTAATKSVLSGGVSTDVSESLYIGPGTHVINGVWEIYARNVIIDSTAVISGSGFIYIYNPSAAGGTSAATSLDANNLSAALDVKLVLSNNAGMKLENQSFPASLTAASWSNNANSSTLYLGQNLDLFVDGAHLSLGTGVVGDLKLSSAAGIIGYRPQRMVVTNNSVLSHLVKESYSSAFVFPVGIAAGDYTPAMISNAASNTVRVSVQDYTASASDEATADPGPGGIPADGMNRTWHIYADNAGIATGLTLQHNSATNQSGFSDANQFVTQWSTSVPNTSGDNAVPFSSSAWQSNTGGAGSVGALVTGAATLSGSSMRSRSYSGLATGSAAAQSYFTKSSDPFHPLPLQILSFTAQADACNVQLNWTVAESPAPTAYELLHSADGKQFETIRYFAPDAQMSSYAYVHQGAASGMHYYRIKVLSADQEVHYTPTRAVNVDCAAMEPQARVYPNPSSDHIVVDGLYAQKVQTIRILTADGKQITERPTSGPREVFDVAKWPQGVYLLQLLEGNEMKFTARFEKF